MLKKITHHAAENFSKNNVASIEPWGLDGGEEKLGSVSVFTSVSH